MRTCQTHTKKRTGEAYRLPDAKSVIYFCLSAAGNILGTRRKVRTEAVLPFMTILKYQRYWYWYHHS